MKPPRPGTKTPYFQDGPVSAFQRARAIIQEHHDRYLLAVEHCDGRIEWIAKSQTWAEGACARIAREFDTRERKSITEE